ncbi:MAG TPA: DUF4432 family protein [Pirellulales bacterium]|nr:DUF4432 family protein [Pirellulales bacterium]
MAYNRVLLVDFSSSSNRGVIVANQLSALQNQSAPNFENAPVLNPAQLGGIETSVLDNGPGRGVRIAWVNTGGGLRYKVVVDRGLDIADAEFFGQSLTWHSLTGITAPTAAYDQGLDWLWSFYGGLVVSCGPLNTGAPFTEDGKSYGLHGTHSNTAAIVESIVNPDPLRGQLEMSIAGLIRTARVFGPNIELRRTITSRLGVPAIHISDEFTNRDNQRLPLAWLLHINFGYPLLEPGASTYCYRGVVKAIRGEDWFRPNVDYKAAPPPMDAHCGTGEFCAYVDPEVDASGQVISGLVNRTRGFGVKIEHLRHDYQRLANWQHWGPGGSYMGALEPTNAGVEGRPKDAQRGWLQYLEPGESRTLQCTISATNDQTELQRLLALNG